MAGVSSVQKTFADVVAGMPSFLKYGQENNIVIPKKNYGVCATGDGTKWSAEWSRFSRGAFQLTVDASGNLNIAATQKISLLSAGPGETGQTGLPYSSTDSENDLSTKGAPCDLDTAFAIFGVAFSVQRPYVFVPVAGATPAFKRYDLFLDSIIEKLQDLLISELNIKFTWKDAACQAVGGPFENWPTAGGAQGGSIVANGRQMGIGNLVPLRAPMIAGPQDSLSQMFLDVANGIALQIPTDPLNPPDPEVTVVQLPVQAQVYGAQFDTCSVACPPDPQNMSPEMRAGWAAALQMFADMKANGQLPPGMQTPG